MEAVKDVLPVCGGVCGYCGEWTCTLLICQRMGWLRSSLLILCGLVERVLGLGLFEERGLLFLGRRRRGMKLFSCAGCNCQRYILEVNDRILHPLIN